MKSPKNISASVRQRLLNRGSNDWNKDPVSLFRNSTGMSWNMIDFIELDQLKQHLDSYGSLPKGVIENIHEDLVLRLIYNSNAIEGNSLSLKETKVVLEGIAIGGKPLREHFEVLNHRDAIIHVEALVERKEPLSEKCIKAIHHLVMKNIDDNNAGVYRAMNVTISGATHVPPDCSSVRAEMGRFMGWYMNEGQQLHPVERAAGVHLDFIGIHPFVDGNGRTARLLMNLELMNGGFPPVVLPVEKRVEYFQELDTAHTRGDCAPFLMMITESVKNAFEPYWFALGKK